MRRPLASTLLLRNLSSELPRPVAFRLADIFVNTVMVAVVVVAVLQLLPPFDVFIDMEG
jgi:hypothetical protein